jgi:fatty-acyl-CoA synthase
MPPVRPDKAITVFEGETTTYGEMAMRARLAGGLAEIGVGAGQVVAILSYNCPEFLETFFAANYLGAIAMPINWRLAAPEIRYILEHSGARALVCDEALVDVASEATAGLEATLKRVCLSPPPGRRGMGHSRRSAGQRPHRWRASRRRPTMSTA